jgi:1-deoxy-D-xylulose-5-phosphate reductoisomerase
MQKLTILGSTGSIGVSTLDVVRRHPDKYAVVALCGHTQIDRLFSQCIEFMPAFAVVRDEALASELSNRLRAAGSLTRVEFGPKALVKMAELPEVETIMAAIVGAAGLPSTLAAAIAGKRVLLANKEALVMAGPVFMRAVKEHGAVLLPIDSEHNAIFQSLPRDYAGDMAGCGVRNLLLTASGGPFRNTPLSDLEHVTPDQACAHPKWAMGRKISVDSATMMNKGLEMIEAHWLFNVPPENIQVVIHPQSIVHSLVQYVDGSVIAELGNPDMRTPIAHALAYPDRVDAGVAPLDLFEVSMLQFERPCEDRFPCLRLAFNALQHGESAPTILNAANEVAVQSFLEGALAYLSIPRVIEAVMGRCRLRRLESLDDVLAADMDARVVAQQVVSELGRA